MSSVRYFRNVLKTTARQAASRDYCNGPERVFESPGAALRVLRHYLGLAGEVKRLKFLFDSLTTNNLAHPLNEDHIQVMDSLDSAFLAQLDSDLRAVDSDILQRNNMSLYTYERIQNRTRSLLRQQEEKNHVGSSAPLIRDLRWTHCSAVLAENLIKRDQARPMTHFLEVKARMGPRRRCFALFESSRAAVDPNTFVWVALKDYVPDRVDQVISTHALSEYSKEPDRSEEQSATTAVFYSINSSGRGPKGSGNLLIKEVCSILQAELPSRFSFFPQLQD